MAVSTFAAGQILTGALLNNLVTSINGLLLPPQCEVSRIAVQSIPHSVATTISFDTQVLDTNNMFAPTSDTITIQTAGRYQCVAGGTIAGNSGLKVWEVTKNGVIQRSGAATGPDTALQTGRTNIVVEFVCVIGDVIKVQVFQNTGVAQNATAGLTVRRISD